MFSDRLLRGVDVEFGLGMLVAEAGAAGGVACMGRGPWSDGRWS